MNNRTDPETHRYHSKDLSQLFLYWTEDIKSHVVKFDLLKHFQADIPKAAGPTTILCHCWKSGSESLTLYFSWEL
jgi:hypothetical protein